MKKKILTGVLALSVIFHGLGFSALAEIDDSTIEWTDNEAIGAEEGLDVTEPDLIDPEEETTDAFLDSEEELLIELTEDFTEVTGEADISGNSEILEEDTPSISEEELFLEEDFFEESQNQLEEDGAASIEETADPDNLLPDPETAEDELSDSPSEEPEEAGSTSSCGENLTWTFENGTLTISGTGDMDDFTGAEDVPWAEDRESITTLVIEDGVTSIGSYAFIQCTNLKDITIAGSVARIGQCAFCECSSIEEIELPEIITVIEYRTFYNCTSLRKMTSGHSHVRETIPGKPATCTENGYTDKIICSVCQEVLQESMEIPAPGHTPVKDEGKPATCTEPGLTEGSHCSECTETLVPQKEIPAAGHKFGAWTVTKEATAIGAGLKERTCSVCKIKETQTIPKLKPTITLSPKSVTVNVNKSQKVTISDLAAGDKALSWESDKPAIATVNNNGLITGVSAGKCTVTVTLKSGLTATVSVTVKETLQQPVLIAAYNGAKGIGVKFHKVANATEYVIYQKFQGKWGVLTTVSATAKELQISGDSIMYTDTSVVKDYGKGYIYSVAAKKGNLTSTYNQTGVAIYRLQPPTLTKTVNSAAGIATVYWKSIFGKTETNGNYDLQCAEYINGKAGKFTSVKKAPGFSNLTLNTKVTGLKKGKSYVFRIRCSKTNKDRGTFYSEYSPWMSVKITK